MASTGDAYVTDSTRPILFKVPDGASAAEPWLNLFGTVFKYQDGTNANGIVVTADDQLLIVVQINTGQLYRIDTASEEVTEINLGGEMLVNGDGLVLDERTLYVVRNADNRVDIVELSADFSRCAFASSIQHETFAFLTTAHKLATGCWWSTRNSTHVKVRSAQAYRLPWLASSFLNAKPSPGRGGGTTPL